MPTDRNTLNDSVLDGFNVIGAYPMPSPGSGFAGTLLSAGATLYRTLITAEDNPDGVILRTLTAWITADTLQTSLLIAATNTEAAVTAAWSAGSTNSIIAALTCYLGTDHSFANYQLDRPLLIPARLSVRVSFAASADAAARIQGTYDRV